jgi:hypothetical protein
VNGNMILDLQRAMARLDRGLTSAGSRGVDAWMRYADRATRGGTAAQQQRLLWLAHQTSLHAGVRRSMDEFAYESFVDPMEGLFINTVITNVDASAVERVPTNDPLIGDFIGAYPPTYPADPEWALTWTGVAVNSEWRHGNIGVESTRW